MAFAGLSWLSFLLTPLADYLSPHNLAAGVLDQGALAMWLIVAGVDNQRGKK
jgi:hypothetical protein